MAILMHQGETGQDRPVINVHMASQRSVVDQDAVVANYAVMADVGIGHHQVVVTQGGFCTVLHSPTVNGHAFVSAKRRSMPCVVPTRWFTARD